MPIIAGPTNIEGAQFKGIAKFQYDYNVHGGLVSAINITGDPLPDGAIVYGGVLDVITALTGAGATVALSINAANDLVSAAAISGAPWSTTGLKAIVPIATAATSIKLTAERYVVATITGAVLTAGKFNLTIIYFRSSTA